METSTELYNLICQRRGWTPQTLAAMMATDYEPLKDIDTASALLEQIRSTGSHICVATDFDMDGITAGVQLFIALAELGFFVHLYPTQPDGGHGVSVQDVDTILQRHPEVKAIITCDTGITSLEAIDHAKRRIPWFIVTDHHKQQPKTPAQKALIEPDVIINPARLDETYALTGVCGAYVVYQLVEDYTRRYQPHRLGTIEYLKLWAGIGTVSDVMPMFNQNRTVVTDSIGIAQTLFAPPPPPAYREEPKPADPEAAPLLQILRSEEHHPLFVAAYHGMAVVLAEWHDYGKVKTVEAINEGFYGFYLAPMFNAIRRMQTPIEDAFELFLTTDTVAKREITRKLIENNERRKELVAEYVDSLLTDEQPYAPYIYLTDAPAGMLGLLANDLMHKSGVPTLVLSDKSDTDEREHWTGSARSPMWLAYNSMLDSMGIKVAGHEQAFGVGVGSRKNVHALHRLLAERIPETIEALTASGEMAASDEPDLRLGVTPDCDGQGTDTDELVELVNRIEKLAPFGHAFDRPTVEVVANLRECSMRTMGSEQQHFKISTPAGIDCVWWKHAEQMELLQQILSLSTEDVEIVRMRGTLSINEFNGKTSITLKIDSMVVD